MVIGIVMTSRCGNMVEEKFNKDDFEKVIEYVWTNREILTVALKRFWGAVNGDPAKIPQSIFKYGGDITNKEVKNLLGEQLNCTKDVKFYIGDHDYKTTDMTSLFLATKFLNVGKWLPYTVDARDCDNYARTWNGILGAVLPELAIAEVRGSGHAMNIFIDNDWDVWYVEPQNDWIFKNGLYRPYVVWM